MSAIAFTGFSRKEGALYNFLFENIWALPRQIFNTEFIMKRWVANLCNVCVYMCVCVCVCVAGGGGGGCKCTRKEGYIQSTLPNKVEFA